jgi:hypothetical protein
MIFSGGFCEVGVKNEATAVSESMSAELQELSEVLQRAYA